MHPPQSGRRPSCLSTAALPSSPPGAVLFFQKSDGPGSKKRAWSCTLRSPAGRWPGDSRNITTRGIVLFAGQGLPDMYRQRVTLYEKYADITIDCEGKDFEEVVRKVMERPAGFRV